MVMKCNLIGFDIFTGKRYMGVYPVLDDVRTPVQKDYFLADVTVDGFASLVDEVGNCRELIKLPQRPDDFSREIETAFASRHPYKVTVVSAM
mmetsp:Transcript_3989/g.5963  ORF Transcript_3989/g.5963 Transcript_3989/m.5963 type:complete len:92 (-) Transcript_3989:70-345(-)